MRRPLWYRVGLLLLAALSLAAWTLGQDITPAERERALAYLAQSEKGLVEAVQGLSETQWSFKPAPDRWSVAEVVEHVAVVEDVVGQKIFTQYAKAPAPAADRDAKQIDAMILERVTDRTTKFQAPPAAQPTGRWTPEGALERFLAARGETTSILKTNPDLRGHVVAHPVFGPLDGYQWILAVAAHTERHTKQIREVEADPNFPRK